MLSASRRASVRVPSDEYCDGMETQWILSAPTASAAIAAVSAESIPPESPIDDLGEAVLPHVVAETEHERLPHLLELVVERDDLRRRDVGLLSRRVELDRPDDLEAAAVPRERAPARIREAARDDRRRIDVDDEQRLLEAGRPREHRALVVEHDRVAVEEELVLPADGVAERDVRGVVARADAEHLLALAILAEMERRRRDVHEQLRAGEREIGGRRPRLPHVLADRHADDHVTMLEQEELVAGREVAHLVEDAVVRQEPLPHERLDLAVRAHRARVVEVALEIRRADERDDAARRRGYLRQRLLRRADEPGPQQQILRRIARHRQLREDDEVGAGALRLLEPLEDQRAVAVEVADGRVRLDECEAHLVSDYQAKTYRRRRIALRSSAWIASIRVAQLLRRIVLRMEVAAGQRVELARRERVHQHRRALGRRPRRVVGDATSSSPSSRDPG